MSKKQKIAMMKWNDCYWIYSATPWCHTVDLETQEELYNNYKDYIELDTNTSEIKFANVKNAMLNMVHQFFTHNNIPFDEFNGLPPSRVNRLIGYEFPTLFIWCILIGLIEKNNVILKEFNKKGFYNKYKRVISSVFKQYPKLTGTLIVEVDLHYPNNQFLDIAMSDDVDFDKDTTDSVENNSKADEFNNWILNWSSKASSKDKMRVAHWFETKKSHKQIFAEIQKVVGNPAKFNCRLALFIERICNNDNLDYFFEKTGFETKEDMFMAYFEKLTMFDDDTKKSFIKKYLVK